MSPWGGVRLTALLDGGALTAAIPEALAQRFIESGHAALTGHTTPVVVVGEVAVARPTVDLIYAGLHKGVTIRRSVRAVIMPTLLQGLSVDLLLPAPGDSAATIEAFWTSIPPPAPIGEAPLGAIIGALAPGQALAE